MTYWMIKKAKCKEFLVEQKKQLLTATIAVFIWGMVAHAYGFLNMTLSHDSITEFVLASSTMLHKIGLGRFAEPIYLYLFHSKVATPWLNGLLTLCWLSVSVWLTANIFSIKDKLRIILISGIFTVNITVTALAATFITDLDSDMFGVMNAVIAVFLWHKNRKTAWLGIPFIVLVLGLYQSMLSVFITLIMFVSILSLLQGEKASGIILKGMQAVIMIILAGVAYILLVKLSCIVFGTQLSTDYNGLTNLFKSKGGAQQYIELILTAYTSWVDVFSLSMLSAVQTRMLHILLAIPTFIVLIHALCQKTLSAVNKILAFILIIILPIGMNISCIADGGMVHHLMLYSAWLIYLFVILLTDQYEKSNKNIKAFPKLCCIIATLFLILILALDVKTANAAYIKKELERQSTHSVMSTVSLEMSRTENYALGETDVVFVGKPQTGTNKVFPNLAKIWGLNDETAVTYNWSYYYYFKYILQTPFSLSTDEIPEEFTASMPSFPQEGYIQWYDGILVVKLSD